jgi:predicted dehydrogenase
MLAVCHVLRYAPFFKKVKDIIDSGVLGDICNEAWMYNILSEHPFAKISYVPCATFYW